MASNHDLNTIMATNEKLIIDLEFALKCVKTLMEMKSCVKQFLDSKTNNLLILMENDCKKLNDLIDKCDKVLAENRLELHSDKQPIRIHSKPSSEWMDVDDTIEIISEESDQPIVVPPKGKDRAQDKSGPPLVKWSQPVKCLFKGCDQQFDSYLGLNKHWKVHRLEEADSRTNTMSKMPLKTTITRVEKEKLARARPGKPKDTKNCSPTTKIMVNKVAVLQRVAVKCPVLLCQTYLSSAPEMSTHCQTVHGIQYQKNMLPMIANNPSLATNGVVGNDTTNTTDTTSDWTSFDKRYKLDKTKRTGNAETIVWDKSAEIPAKVKKSRIVENQHFVTKHGLQGDKTVLLFQCILDNCHRIFTGYTLFCKHLSIHYKCPISSCDFAAQCESYLDYHLKDKHPDYLPHKCLQPSCPFSFATKSQFDKHMKRHRSPKIFDCDFVGCSKRFSTTWQLKKHLQVHENERPFKCDVEGCTFATKQVVYLRRHKKTVHGANERPFVCDHEGCALAFKSQLELKYHKLNIHFPRWVVCPVDECRSKVKDNYLSTHLKECHSQDVFTCDQPGCQFITNTVKKLSRHQHIHTDGRKFVCQWKNCDKGFHRRRQLDLHLLCHKNEKTFHCDWPGCQFRTNTKSSLQYHVRYNHEPQKIQYRRCHWPGCDKQFKNARHLGLHLNSHTRKKPMVCDFPGCNYRSGCSYFYTHRKKHFK